MQNNIEDNTINFNDFSNTQSIFQALQNSDLHVEKHRLEKEIASAGFLADDERILQIFNDIKNDFINKEEFSHLIEKHALLRKIILRDISIPAFEEFSHIIRSIFEYTKQNEKGNVATYIPQLALVDPNYFGVSLCTLDGQRLNIGDATIPFCLQSASKPINYCLALEEYGEGFVHHYVGREPSGRGFNELQLNYDGLPHNPLINAGAIMCCALIKHKKTIADRFDYIKKTWEALSGGYHIGFNHAVYLSERETADRNFALAYFMNEKKIFPNQTDLATTLDLYFGCCSIEMTCESLSVVAATLAGGGICPLTNKKLFDSEHVKNCLSLMQSCGMYDFSGEFAFTVGIPAKSGVSGVLLVVVPGLMGLALYSPRLDALGNSVRGVEFCKQLIEIFHFHPFETVITNSLKIDPRQKKSNTTFCTSSALFFAAKSGDIKEIQCLIASGIDINQTNYDHRSPLHIATSEGKEEVVKYLIEKGCYINPVDRWNRTPLDDALELHFASIAELLKNSGGKRKTELPDEAL